MNYVSVANIHRTHNTRHTCYFNIPSFRTDIRGKCIAIGGAKCFNSLPLQIQRLNGLGFFKRELHAFYVNSYTVLSLRN